MQRLSDYISDNKEEMINIQILSNCKRFKGYANKFEIMFIITVLFCDYGKC